MLENCVCRTKYQGTLVIISLDGRLVPNSLIRLESAELSYRYSDTDKFAE